MHTLKQLIILQKELREKEEENQKKLFLLKGLIRGEKAILEDRIVPHSKAKKRMSRWLD